VEKKKLLRYVQLLKDGQFDVKGLKKKDEAPRPRKRRRVMKNTEE